MGNLSPAYKIFIDRPEHPLKNCFFCPNPYKIEVMITSVIEALEFPNFGHMTTSAKKL